MTVPPSKYLVESDFHQMAGEEYLFCGELFVGNDVAFIEVDDADRSRICISDATLEVRLLDHVPCYVGGEYLYRDKASLVGRIEIKSDVPIIDRVTSVVITRDDEGEYTV